MNEDGYSGPSWKWMLTMVASVMVPLIGAILIWIASTLQSLITTMPSFSTQLTSTSKQLEDIRGQLATINSSLNTTQTNQAILDTEYKELLDRVARVEDMTSNNADWIDAHIHADRAIHKARQAEHD